MGSVESRKGFVEEVTFESGLEGGIEVQQYLMKTKRCLLHKHLTQPF